MEAQDFFDHVQADSTQLYVRLFIDFTDERNPNVTADFLQSEEGVVHEWRGRGEFRRAFDAPPLYKETWSDPAFTRKKLFPRLEKHPEWLDPRPVVMLVLLNEGSPAIVLNEIGQIGALYLQGVLLTDVISLTMSKRLQGILMNHVRSHKPLQLLL